MAEAVRWPGQPFRGVEAAICDCGKMCTGDAACTTAEPPAKVPSEARTWLVEDAYFGASAPFKCLKTVYSMGLEGNMKLDSRDHNALKSSF